MIKIFLLLITIFNLYADDTIVQTKENVLRIQNMIELEEKIAEIKYNIEINKIK